MTSSERDAYVNKAMKRRRSRSLIKISTSPALKEAEQKKKHLPKLKGADKLIKW